MSILSLPVEIIILIGENCYSLRDLNAFSQANCQLFTILNKHLYRRDFSACDRGFVIAAGKDNEFAVRKIIQEAKGRRLPFTDAVACALVVKSNTTLTLPILVEAIPKSDFLEEFLESLPNVLQRSAWSLYNKGYLVHRVELLLSILHNVDLSQRPKLSTHLWEWVSRNPRVRFAKLLFKSGAQPSDLHYRAIFSYYYNSFERDRREAMTKLFLIMCPDSARISTIFFAAVQENCLSAVEILMQAGADLKALDANGHPPLWHAISEWRHSTTMAKYLLEHGSSPNAASADGTTLVGHAIDNDFYEALDILFDHGADFSKVTLQNCKKLVCQDIPRKKFRYLQRIVAQRVEILRDQDVQEALRKIFPIKCCDDQTFEKILGHLRWFGAHCQSNVVASINLFDRSLVSLIPKNGTCRVALIRRLLEFGADPNVHIPRHGSALGGVAKGKGYGCLKLLMKHGLDVDKWDHSYLQRILGLAITSGNLMLVRWLLDKGIDPDFNQKQTRCGPRAPLWEAISRKQSSIIQPLISAGANIRTRQDGWTLLGYVANNRVLSTIQPYLKQAQIPWKNLDQKTRQL